MSDQKPKEESDFATMSKGLLHESGRPLTRLEAANKIFYYNDAPRTIEGFHQKCIQQLREHLEKKSLKSQRPGKRYVQLDHSSFMAAKIRVSHAHLRAQRLTEIENQVLIAGQENAIDGLRLQTFMDYDLKTPKVPRSNSMTPFEIALLEKLIRDTSCRHHVRRI